MSALGDWLTNTWTAVWPNLLASVLWVPVTVVAQAVVHRYQLRRHLRTHRANVVRDVVAELRSPPA